MARAREDRFGPGDPVFQRVRVPPDADGVKGRAVGEVEQFSERHRQLGLVPGEVGVHVPDTGRPYPVDDRGRCQGHQSGTTAVPVRAVPEPGHRP